MDVYIRKKLYVECNGGLSLNKPSLRRNTADYMLASNHDLRKNSNNQTTTKSARRVVKRFRGGKLVAADAQTQFYAECPFFNTTFMMIC